jgi:hypothetical protein
VPFVDVVSGGRTARSVKKQVEQSPERDELAAVRPRALTSDLHGGCGTKLTIGFWRTPLAGRFTCRRPPPTLNRSNVMNASQLIVSLPHLGGGWSANQSPGCVKSAGVKFVNDQFLGIGNFDEMSWRIQWSENEFSHSRSQPAASLQLVRWSRRFTTSPRAGGLAFFVDMA